MKNLTARTELFSLATEWTDFMEGLSFSYFDTMDRVYDVLNQNPIHHITFNNLKAEGLSLIEMDEIFCNTETVRVTCRY